MLVTFECDGVESVARGRQAENKESSLILIAALGFLVFPLEWVAVIVYLIALNRYVIHDDARSLKRFNAWRKANMDAFDALPDAERERRWQAILR